MRARKRKYTHIRTRFILDTHAHTHPHALTHPPTRTHIRIEFILTSPELKLNKNNFQYFDIDKLDQIKVHTIDECAHTQIYMRTRAHSRIHTHTYVHTSEENTRIHTHLFNVFGN